MTSFSPTVLFQKGCFKCENWLRLLKLATNAVSLMPWTSGPGFVANLQVAASIPGCDYIEYPYDPPSFLVESLQGTLRKPLRIDEEGFVHLPQEPGLGVELDKEAIDKFQVT